MGLNQIHLVLDVIQGTLETSTYWSIGISPDGAHDAAPLHELAALEARADGLLGPALGAKVSVSHDPSLDQVRGRRKATGVLGHQWLQGRRRPHLAYLGLEGLPPRFL